MSPTSGPPDSDASLEFFWQDLRATAKLRRAKTLGLHWKPPTCDAVQNWVSAMGTPVLAIDGPSVTHRQLIYKWLCANDTVLADGHAPDNDLWLTEGVMANFVRRVSRCDSERQWGLLWRLLHIEDFTVAEPLRGIIDQGHHLTPCFKAIWEARFLLREKSVEEALFRALPKWMTGASLTFGDKEALGKVHITKELNPVEQLDMLFFLLALAHQNGITDKVIFVFDGLERGLKDHRLLNEVYNLTCIVDRWLPLGSATAYVLGYSSERGFYQELKAAHPKLAKLVQRSLV
jgi:hypothetical protein